MGCREYFRVTGWACKMHAYTLRMRAAKRGLSVGINRTKPKSVFLFDRDCTFRLRYIERPENIPLAVKLHLTISLESV
jgi:hypothetical protein